MLLQKWSQLKCQSIIAVVSHHWFHCLCRTMACFHVILISLISDGDYPRVHYFLWRLPLCQLLSCSMTQYDITMGNDIASDIHCDITMSNDIFMCTSQFKMTSIVITPFIMYYYAYL